MTPIPAAGNSPSPPLSATQSSTAISTSTQQYSQDCFETFRNKIIDLSNRILPPNSTVQRVTHRHGGAFNRVIAVDLCLGHDGTPIPAIYRIPRGPALNDQTANDGVEDLKDLWTALGDQIANDSIKDQCAILNYVRSLGIPVPKVLAYDSFSKNPLGSAYVLQSRLEGFSLDLIYSNLTCCQKTRMAIKLGELCLKLDRTNFPVA